MSTKKTISSFLALSIVLLIGLLFKNSPLAPQTKSVQGIQTDASSSAMTVSRVLDGDTLELQNGEKIRLIGINSPERDQPFYDEARKKLEEYVLNQEITYKKDISEKDRYGRILAYVYTPQVFVNEKMIEDGYAVSDTTPPDVAYSEVFVEAQKTARQNCSGIWEGLCNPSASSCVQLSKIQKNGKEKNDEWVELLNTCKSPQNISGYLIKDNSASNSYLFKDASMSAKATLKLHTGCGNNTATDFYWACPEQHNFIWNNDTDRAYLFDNSGKLISEIGY